jgi:hypothetical protein
MAMNNRPVNEERAMSSNRFVILLHECEETHYDLMLEDGSVLRTWKLRQPPAPGRYQTAVRSFDHRTAYLEYEGPIDGNRGHVTQWDAGTYAGELTEGPAIRVELRGKRLRGWVTLDHIRDEQWTCGYSGFDLSTSGSTPEPRLT